MISWTNSWTINRISNNHLSSFQRTDVPWSVFLTTIYLLLNEPMNPNQYLWQPTTLYQTNRWILISICGNHLPSTKRTDVPWLVFITFIYPFVYRSIYPKVHMYGSYTSWCRLSSIVCRLDNTHELSHIRFSEEFSGIYCPQIPFDCDCFGPLLYGAFEA